MNRPSDPGAPAPGGDPWAAFGYLVAGVGFYGFAGWGLSIWLHHDYWIPIGILVGAGFGLYLVFARYLLRGSDEHDDPNPGSSTTTDDDDAARRQRPDSDDRGETA
jgi:ATP synthase protein I